LPVAAQLAGSASLPVFSVVKAILRPWPSSPIRLLAGTVTSCSLVTPFSRPRSPMNALRRSTVMPGAVPSTTNAVMPPRCPSLLGTLAITTSSSATVPLVLHSLTPFST
jgi:predicted transcriptional regulator